MEEDKKSTIQSVEKTFDIIERLEMLRSATVTELASELGLNKTTVYSHLKTLQNSGYIIKDDNEYSLSFRFLEHGGKLRNQRTLYTKGQAQTRTLAREIDELVHLGYKEQDNIVIIYNSRGPSNFEYGSPVGSYLDPHSTALGKAILAYMPEVEVHRLIARSGLPEHTENTITDKNEFLNELQKIRDQEYAFNDEENSYGLRSLGAPIVPENTPIGAMSITCPKTQLSDDQYIDELVHDLLSVTNIIELNISQGQR